MPDAVETQTTTSESASAPAHASEAAPAAGSAPAEPKTPSNDATSEEIGEAGKAAIQKERAARQDLERKLAEAQQLQDELKQKVHEFEDRDKTDQQRLTDQVAALEKRLADKETEIAKAQQASLRAAVAAEKGVPIGSLTGTTKEELEQSADDLIAWREASAPKRPPKPPTPAAGLTSGASGTGDLPTDPKERAAYAVRKMRAAGA